MATIKKNSYININNLKFQFYFAKLIVYLFITGSN